MAVIRFADGARAGQPIVVMSTELNSLANGSGIGTTTAIDNDGASALDLYVDLELNVTFGTAPTDNAPVEVWMRRTVDGGTSFEDVVTGASPVPPRNGYVGSFFVRNVTSAQRLILPRVALYPYDFHLFVINRSGQAFPASGSTIRARFYKLEVV